MAATFGDKKVEVEGGCGDSLPVRGSSLVELFLVVYDGRLFCAGRAGSAGAATRAML